MAGLDGGAFPTNRSKQKLFCTKAVTFWDFSGRAGWKNFMTMTMHYLKSIRFSNITNSVHPVSTFAGMRAISSRWRPWLAVALLAGGAGASRAQVTNGGFDAATLSPGQFLYYGAQSQPVDSWTYAGAAGIATDSSNKVAFATGYPGVYPGTNYAFLQTSTGTPSAIEQSVMLPNTGQWLMTFDIAGRLAGSGSAGSFGGNASFNASIIDSNGVTLVSRSLVTSSGQLFTNQTVGFTAQNKGPFTLRFDNVQNTSGSDNTVFIDNVRLVSPPAITSQPTDQVISRGQTATLGVGVSGTAPLTYQWYSGALGDTSNPVGTNSSYTTPPLSAAATFWVQVLNAAGPNYAATSRLASVQIVTGFTLSQQPSGLTVCAGNPAAFTVGFTAPSIPATTIQWQRRGLGGSYTNIPGATSTNYTIAAASAADDRSFFRAVFSNTGTNLITAEAPLSVMTISAPTIVYDFSSGVPTNTSYGRSYVNTPPPATTNGWLDLMDPGVGGNLGFFLTADLAPGQAVSGFIAHFPSFIIPPPSGPMGDGFSFNWASDLPSYGFIPAEQGTGSGLRVCFRTYDDGSGTAPAIDVKWAHNLIGRFLTTDAFLSEQGTNADIMVRLNTDGTFDMTYRCVSIFTRLPIPGYQPLFNSRFNLGSAAGNGQESVWIQNISLQLFVDPTNGVPGFTSMTRQGLSGLAINGAGAPNGQYPLFTSQDLVNWQFRTNVTLGSNGVFQFVEPDISWPPQQFYRLKAAPSLPSGLVSWWRGDDNYLDSIGGRNGIPPTNAPGFTAGIRTPAFNFGGTNALSINSAALPAPWTLCCWVIRPPCSPSPYKRFSLTPTAACVSTWTAMETPA
jgi:hypothetical protein